MLKSRPSTKVWWSLRVRPGWRHTRAAGGAFPKTRRPRADAPAAPSKTPSPVNGVRLLRLFARRRCPNAVPVKHMLTDVKCFPESVPLKCRPGTPLGHAARLVG